MPSHFTLKNASSPSSLPTPKSDYPSVTAEVCLFGGAREDSSAPRCHACHVSSAFLSPPVEGLESLHVSRAPEPTKNMAKLHAATRNDRVDTVASLLDSGVDVDAVNEDG
eukprot:scaffold7500_cov286-Pinguiococcus_pyrenoidosus.AAC.1